MRFWNWLWRTRENPRSEPTDGVSVVAPKEWPSLREFVYLDEVSLRSLLASQQGALTESISILESRASEAELAASLGASTGLLNAEVSSRFQTSRSEEQQVSRKAIVQSLFKEFRELDHIDDVLLQLNTGTAPAANVSGGDLARGTLVEVRVELLADPIFRFSSVMDELLDISADYPDMMAGGATASVMGQMGPMNRILQRLMVGLVPIRATAVDLFVREEAGAQVVVRTDQPTPQDLPLEIVGVTDQRNYWQDVRRALFSGSQFTMLCRIAHGGVRDHWSAVKAADVLAEIVPAFPVMLEAVGDTDYAAPEDRLALSEAQRLKDAMKSIYGLSAIELGLDSSELDESVLAELLQRHAHSSAEPRGQREALDDAIRQAELSADKLLDPSRKYHFRDVARQQSGLRILGGQRVLEDLSTPSSKPRQPRALLETELIAIYW